MRTRTRARYVLAHLASLLSREPRDGFRTLVYHSLVPSERDDPDQMTTPVALFEEHLQLLRSEGYAVLPLSACLDRLARQRLPRRAVALSFDDGFRDNLVLGLPVLARHGHRAAIFVASGRAVGTSGSASAALLSAPELREMDASGHFGIGCHGASHRRLRGLRHVDLVRETFEAKQSLEQVLGHGVGLFAHPFGSFDSFDRHVAGSVRRAGFIAAFTSIFGMNTPATDSFALRRCRVSWSEDVPAFRRLLSGAYDWYAAVQLAQSVIRLAARGSRR